MLRLSLIEHKTLLWHVWQVYSFFINYSFISLSLLQSCRLFASLTLHILILEMMSFCHVILSQPSALMEIMWNKEDLVCHCKDGQMIESCEGRVSLSLQDRMCLWLWDVRRSQKGLCICEVIYECQTLQDTICISFSCKYSNKHVSNMNGQEKTIDNYK